MKTVHLFRLSIIIAVALFNHSCVKTKLSGCHPEYSPGSQQDWSLPWNLGVAFNPTNDSDFACLRNGTVYVFHLGSDTMHAYSSQQNGVAANFLLGWCPGNQLALNYGEAIYTSNTDGSNLSLLADKGSLQLSLPYSCIKPVDVTTHFLGGPFSELVKTDLVYTHTDGSFTLIDTLYGIRTFSVNTDGRIAVPYNRKFVNIYNNNNLLSDSHRLIADESVMTGIRVICWAGADKIAWADDTGIFLTDVNTWSTTALQTAAEHTEYLNLSGSANGQFIAATYRTYNCANYSDLVPNTTNPELQLINTQTGEDHYVGAY